MARASRGDLPVACCRCVILDAPAATLCTRHKASHSEDAWGAGPEGVMTEIPGGLGSKTDPLDAERWAEPLGALDRADVRRVEVLAAPEEELEPCFEDIHHQ